MVEFLITSSNQRPFSEDNLMANPEHLKILEQGVEAWNKWREQHGVAKVDLSGANLSEAVLMNAKFQQANFIETNLRGAILNGADFFKAKVMAANLQGAYIQETDFEEVCFNYSNLQGAHLQKSKFKNASLFKVNLQGAHLEETAFLQADLNATILREAYLQDANLTDVKGLQSSQLAGANVSGAKLPADIAKFEGLTQIEKISQCSKKLFLSLLLSCVYCWLTISTTTDVELITNSRSSSLPIIQTNIPIVGFYAAAPLILLSLYIWFHLYLQRLWERLSQLPAVFPNGEALDEKVYPWLISGMVRSHVQILKEHRPALSRIQTGISILLAWWLVPFTFLLFWLRYVPRHDWVGTSLHVGVLAVSITAALLLYRLAAKTLRGERTSSLSWKEKMKSLQAYQHSSLTLGILGLCLISFLTLSIWTIEGVRLYQPINSWEDLSTSPPEMIPYEWHDGLILLPRLFDYFGYRTYANLEEADISTKPPTWTGQEEKLPDEIPLVKGAKLQNANLQNANMVGAFIVNADLSRANLQKARLQMANLQRAKLRETNLSGARLSGTNLSGADLSLANLQGAFLFHANLQETNLQMANLQGAFLYEANLQEADLQTANLQGANLYGAKLRAANLNLAKHLTQPQINQACVDKYTKLPEGLTRPEPCKEKKSPPWLPLGIPHLLPRSD